MRGFFTSAGVAVRCRRGVSPIEAALAAPFLCLLLAGVTDAVEATAFQIRLHAAAERAARAAATLAPGNRASFERAAGMKVDAVDVERFSACGSAAAAAGLVRCTDGSRPRDYVEVRLTASFTPEFRARPLAAGGGGPDEGPVHLHAESVQPIG